MRPLSRIAHLWLLELFLAFGAFASFLLAYPIYFSEESSQIASDPKVPPNNHETPVVTWFFDSRDLILSVHEVVNENEISKIQEIRITSWYNKAKVNRVNLLHDNREFYFVEFEGNCGTGVLQSVLAIYGWRGYKLVPVLIESVSYHIETQNRHTDLQVRYAIQHGKENSTVIQFAYEFSDLETDRKVSNKWDDVLTWDEASFSFYGKNAVEGASKASIPVRNRINEVRSKVAKLLHRISDIDLDLMGELGLADILDIHDILDIQ